jgi:hypothetical protein
MSISISEHFRIHLFTMQWGQTSKGPLLSVKRRKKIGGDVNIFDWWPIRFGRNWRTYRKWHSLCCLKCGLQGDRLEELWFDIDVFRKLTSKADSRAIKMCRSCRSSISWLCAITEIKIQWEWAWDCNNSLDRQKNNLGQFFNKYLVDGNGRKSKPNGRDHPCQ